MDLVTCPKCRFAFSPTPGKAIKCPSCLTALSVASKAAPVKAGTPPKKGKPEAAPQPQRRQKQPPKKNYSGIMLVASILIVLMLGGGVVVFNVFSSTKGGKKTPAGDNSKVAEAVIPEVIVPKAAPAPKPQVTDDPDTPVQILPDLPSKTKPGKVRPIDKSDAQPVPVVPVKPPVKEKKIVIRDVPGVTPDALNGAIGKGVKFLSGTTAKWFNHDSYQLGYVALGGLTLLECRSPRDETVVKQAAALTRTLAVNHDRTYEISLAIMFLERLGDPSDKKLIQILAARLIAGQEPSGGFGYGCPVISVAESSQLLAYLESTRPRKAPAPLAAEPGEKMADKLDLPKANDGGLDPFAKNIDQPPANLGAAGDAPNPPPGAGDGEKLVSLPPAIKPKNRLTGVAGTLRLDGKVGNPKALSAKLQAIPAVANAGREKDQLQVILKDFPQTDHSNTQFAILALFVARRHGVASDRAILLAEARMRQLQIADGGWLYQIPPNGAPQAAAKHDEAMVCAGILSLALGHAVHQSSPAGMALALETDKQIVHATKRLGQLIKDPQEDISKATPAATTYLLWSIERVAVLYNSPTIEGKDWYGWGSQMLIRNQEENGSWTRMDGYAGATPHVDTCFALLFLVRSNLVQEVGSSQHAPLQVPLPEEAPPP